MTGTATIVTGLEPGMVIHIEPHLVHGRGAGLRPVDVVVEGVRYEDDCLCEAVVDWHSCARFPGAREGQTGCTTYHREQRVLVIGRAA